MAGIHLFTTVLMPLSQIVSYWYVIRSTSFEQFYTVIFYVSSFYWVWAVYNSITDSIDLGILSMGVTAVGTYYSNRIISIIGTILVWLNYTIPSIFILLLWDAKKVAKTFKNDTSSNGIIWAYITKFYFLSNIILWSIILYCFLYSTTITKRPSYQPIIN